MSFRLYDHKLGEWIKDGFYVNSFGDVCFPKKTMFGNGKMSLGSETRYTLHRNTMTHDKYGNPIYEGDICRNTEDHDVVGVVAYSEDHASYYVFDDKASQYYGLVKSNREEMEVIGNVFDNQDVIAKHNASVDEIS